MIKVCFDDALKLGKILKYIQHGKEGKHLLIRISHISSETYDRKPSKFQEIYP